MNLNEPKKTKWTYPGTGVQEAMHLDFCRGSPCFTIICGGTRFVTYVDAGAKKSVCAGGGGDCDCLIVCVANLMETKKSNHAWARTCSKKGSTCSKKCFAAMFELKFFRPLLRPDPQGGMLCPYCGEVRYTPRNGDLAK